MAFLEGSLHNIVIGDKKPMQQLRYYLFTHQNAIMYLVILFIGGIFCGCLLINYFSYDEITQLSSYLISIPVQNEDARNYFTQQVFLNSCILVILLVVGYSLFAIPLISMLIFTKGMQIGFSCAVYVVMYDIRAIVAIIVLLIPQVIFELLAYILIGISSIETSIVLLQSVSTGVKLSISKLIRCNLNYLIYSLLLILVSFFIKCNFQIITEFVLGVLVK